MGDPRHIPVLQTTVLSVLRPSRGETVIDVTLGLGGHARSFLEATAPDGRLIGLDADMQNLAIARERLADAADRTDLRHANFGDITSLDLPPADILFADLGLSSPHVDDPERGFSFKHDGPLDLRFDRTTGRSATQLLAETDEEGIALVLKDYGELRGARHLAGILAKEPPATTDALRARVQQAFLWKAPALLAQVFQALRIWVNDEMAVLERLLDAGPTLLRQGGRMGVLSYHSLEDRAVKHAFRALCEPTKDPVTGKVARDAPYRLLTKKPVRPSAQEIADNPRSRSALLRAIERTAP